MTDYVSIIESRLDELCVDNHTLSESMRYSVMAGGKRMRPCLAMEFCRICGGNIDAALDPGCAIEMVHTYSLIHDDLPSMDNDELRRGMPTNHVKYGECIATLAGDALQSYAFRTILSSDLRSDLKNRCALILADAIGPDGMCYGQFLDMNGEGKSLTEDQLTEINLHKTGDLIAASCMIGAVCADSDQMHIEKAQEFGYKLGLAFQIRDDMLDVLSTTEELGKNVGSDNEENKNTYMVLLGEEGCRAAISKLSEQAIDILLRYFRNVDDLVEYVHAMEIRSK